MRDADGLLRLLQTYNIKHDPEEIREKFDILIKTLRGQRKRTGGADLASRVTKTLGGLRLPDTPPTLSGVLANAAGTIVPPVTVERTPGDFLGNAARWWVKAASSPYLGALVKMTFFIMFFLSYLESTPIVGSVVSVALDATLAGGKALIKTLQKAIPSMLGLIPLPYAQLSGVAVVSVVGLFLWSILAMISFGRQDFTSAIDSMLRIIPIPIGDALADGFLELNHMVDRVSLKKDKLVDDVWSGLLTIQNLTDQVSGVAPEALERVKAGTDAMLNAVQEVREEIPTAVPVAPEEIPTAIPVAPEPAPEALPPTAVPVAPEPAPEPAPAPPMSAMDRLRTQKTSYTAPAQLRGGRQKTLSKKKTKGRKWKTRRRQRK
jgi:hypothetical protein